MGPLLVLKGSDSQVKRDKIQDADAEVERIGLAVEKAQQQLGKLYDKAVKEVGETSAAIFEVHQMMLEDDDYMKARAADIKDISNRLIQNLQGKEDMDMNFSEPAIIVADDLSPSETVQMDKDKILAFVTVHGSSNSHTAILARMMNIPALIGVPLDLDVLQSGMTAVVDGFKGEIIFDPDEQTCEDAKKRMEEEQEVSDFSEVSSCILEEITSRQRKNSSRLISR